MKSGKRNWISTGACITGASHIRNDQPCQDAIAIKKTGGFHIIALSDGHGSSACPYSDEGSKAAVESAIAVFGSIFKGGGDPFHTISSNMDIWLPKQIEKHWKSAVTLIHENCEDREEELFSYELYGATLLVLVAAKDFVFALQLGDGDILAIAPKEQTEDEEAGMKVDWFLPPDDSLGPETNSLCQDDCWKYMKTRIIPLLPGETAPMFFMSTDGYANSFYNDDGFKKAGADFYNIWQEDGLDYIESNLEGWLMESSAQGSGDDIAAAIIAEIVE